MFNQKARRVKRDNEVKTASTFSTLSLCKQSRLSSTSTRGEPFEVGKSGTDPEAIIIIIKSRGKYRHFWMKR